MYLLVVEGPVGAGKTTLIKELKRETGNMKEVDYVEELNFAAIKQNETKYNILEQLYKENLEKNDYVCCQMVIQEELEKHYKRQKQKTITILDRWIPSCGTFIKLRHKQGLISDFAKDFLLKDVETRQENFIKTLHPKTKIITMYLDKTPEECLNNIKKRGRKDEIKKPDEFWKDFNRLFREYALMGKEKHSLIGSGNEIKNNVTSIIRTLKEEDG